MAKQTWFQQEQARKKAERTQERTHHHQQPKQPVEKFGAVPSYLIELFSILEEIWAALPASQSEPNHVVTQKLAAFKAKLPE